MLNRAQAECFLFCLLHVFMPHRCGGDDLLSKQTVRENFSNTEFHCYFRTTSTSLYTIHDMDSKKDQRKWKGCALRARSPDLHIVAGALHRIIRRDFPPNSMRSHVLLFARLLPERLIQELRSRCDVPIRGKL
jgi:hypothetical protein